MYTEQDKLSRIAFIDALEKIIDNKFNDKDGFSFAIDGKWGSMYGTWFWRDVRTMRKSSRDACIL